eukprot:gnl/TRDRNA2_/TRDRNA2_45961_c0_seq1.p1 gnl/TRDRNA2_/TRDRNA2_45961_c0~~gnl/TRDRNA2_/TRDRNA2_45961_c0_seq1.p1  ORF type:complete len:741 (+),score=142.31 gnl/TRDRNA2_/TRDRNA2_45961_c0_seq1:82-2304(+)
MRRDGRPSSQVRSGSASRHSKAAAPAGPSGAAARPPSRNVDGGRPPTQADHAVSPTTSDGPEHGGRSAPTSGRPSPDPGRVYGISQEAHARASAGPGRPVPAPGKPGSAPGGSRARAASSGPGSAARVGSGASAGGHRAASGGAHGGDAITRTPVFSYLRVYGLNQYARPFAEAGLADLDAMARLSESDALDFLERLRVYPGHRLKLLRAIDCLRHASIGAERKDVAQMLEDDAALERLCQQNTALTKEKDESEGHNRVLREENERLLGILRQQDCHLQKARDRIAELEELVQTQTEQVDFLAQQLQMVAEKEPEKESQLFASFRESFNGKGTNAQTLGTRDSYDDWSSAQRINLPTGTTNTVQQACAAGAAAAAAEEEAANLTLSATATFADGKELDKPRTFTPEDFKAEAGNSDAVQEVTPQPTRNRGPQGKPAAGPEMSFSPPRRARMAQSLDSAQIKECLAGFDVDHIVRCLSTAVQNKIILSLSKAKPHTAIGDKLAMCAIFLEPACKERLIQMGNSPASRLGSDGGSPLSFCSPLMSHAGSRLSPGRPPSSGPSSPEDVLNNIAVRCAPNKWDVYGFIRDVMVGFRLQPEVSVITLFYLDRFTTVSGVSLTPDNWQRLTITAMMLASKVWDDESFENVEFAQLCPLYTIDEINTFERHFLKLVGYNMSVKGSDYAKTYFLLRTLGAKDGGDLGGLEPMDEKRASRLTERCLEKQIEFRERYPESKHNDAMNWTL